MELLAINIAVIIAALWEINEWFRQSKLIELLDCMICKNFEC